MSRGLYLFLAEMEIKTTNLGQGSLYIEEWYQQLRDQSWLITECNTYCWCDTVLNAHATNEDKRNDSKDSFYEELEQVLLS